MKLKEYLKSRASLIEGALDRFLPERRQMPGLLHEAMRYSVFGKAKRIRPILALAVSDLFKGNLKNTLIPACAIEMIHAFSLVHDDMPCMDNDEYRRGRPTCHKKYGQAEALLVGDALLTEAFYLLSSYPEPKKGLRLIHMISEAAGSRGMAGGQLIEKELEGGEVDLTSLNLIHVNKTGKLFLASCLAGAVSAGATKKEETKIRRYGECIGLAFQIADDIMDRDGFLKFMSESKAREEVDRLTRKAEREVAGFGKRAEVLIQLAELLGKREN